MFSSYIPQSIKREESKSVHFMLSLTAILILWINETHSSYTKDQLDNNLLNVEKLHLIQSSFFDNK